MTDRSAAVVTRALVATLAVQSLVTMATLTVPVFAPTAAADIGIDASHVGIYASILYLGAMTGSLLSGGFVLRYGAIRVSQLCLLAAAVGIAATAAAPGQLLIVSALLIGLSVGPVTPASSHVLARHTPLNLLSLVFSIKQTGVPAGGVLAGALVPLFVIEFGWRGGAVAVAAICIVCAILIQPVRARYDTGLRPGEALFRGSVIGPLRLVLSLPRLRRLVLVSFAYSAVQQTFSVFLVTYLVTTMEMPLVAAGLALSVGQGAGIVGRIVWGAVADYAGHAQTLLGLLGLATTCSAVAIGLFSPDWSFALILVVTALFGVTGVGWNGVYLAEVSRLAPADQVGRATGGALFVTFAGVCTVPPLFGALAAVTGAYDNGFFALALLTGVSGVALIRGARRDRRLDQSGR